MTSWRDQALCSFLPQLPWTYEAEADGAQLVMATVCHHCPVFVQCQIFAHQHRISSGFWAGRLRDGGCSEETAA